MTQFGAGVVDTGANFPSVVHLHLRISPRIFEKFEMTLTLFSRAWGKMFHEKTWSKKSRDTALLSGQSSAFQRWDFVFNSSTNLHITLASLEQKKNCWVTLSVMVLKLWKHACLFRVRMGQMNRRSQVAWPDSLARRSPLAWPDNSLSQGRSALAWAGNANGQRRSPIAEPTWPYKQLRFSRPGNLKYDWSLPRGSQLVFCQKRYGSDQWAAAPL